MRIFTSDFSHLTCAPMVAAIVLIEAASVQIEVACLTMKEVSVPMEADSVLMEAARTQTEAACLTMKVAIVYQWRGIVY
jgi:hypothetical protein